jgi:hypothetical protein
MPDAIIEDTQANNRLSERLRSGLALAQTRIQTMETRAKNQWTDLPAQLRGAVDRAVALLRTTLDLPSRSDVSELVERLEALDRKIVALEKRQGKRAAGAESAARAGTQVGLDAPGSSEIETPAPVEAAASAKPAAAQREAEDEDEATSDGKTTARKTVNKPTTAGKTVKAGASAGRADDKHGAGKRKKGHRNGQRG